MELDLGQITLIGSTDWLATKMELDRGKVTLIGSTICLMLTMHFSIQLVTEHFMSWKKPKEQKAIIIIVLMAPLYAIDSFIGLIDFMGSKPFFTFLDSVKECYEAIVSRYIANLPIELCSYQLHTTRDSLLTSILSDTGDG